VEKATNSKSAREPNRESQTMKHVALMILMKLNIKYTEKMTCVREGSIPMDLKSRIENRTRNFIQSKRNQLQSKKSWVILHFLSPGAVGLGREAVWSARVTNRHEKVEIAHILRSGERQSENRPFFRTPSCRGHRYCTTGIVKSNVSFGWPLFARA
jgi:hypothetical protein